MTFQDLIESVLDDLLPPPKNFATLKYIEDRHITRAYLITGSQEIAAKYLGISLRTVRNRFYDIFPAKKILSLANNRGRDDIGFLIEFAAHRMPPDLKLPSITQKSSVWRNNRIRGLALHRPDLKPVEVESIIDESNDELEKTYEYPCHRNFEFWDWYLNQNALRQHGACENKRKHHPEELND